MCLPLRRPAGMLSDVSYREYMHGFLAWRGLHGIKHAYYMVSELFRRNIATTWRCSCVNVSVSGGYMLCLRLGMLLTTLVCHKSSAIVGGHLVEPMP